MPEPCLRVSVLILSRALRLLRPVPSVPSADADHSLRIRKSISLVSRGAPSIATS